MGDPIGPQSAMTNSSVCVFRTVSRDVPVRGINSGVALVTVGGIRHYVCKPTTGPMQKEIFRQTEVLLLRVQFPAFNLICCASPSEPAHFLRTSRPNQLALSAGSAPKALLSSS